MTSNNGPALAEVRGAVVGDFLDKPLASGGLALSRYAASGVLLVCIVAAILLLRPRAAAAAH